MSGTYYKKGAFNVICDRCGFKVKSTQTKMEWNNLRTCRKCYEPRHPLDFPRTYRDKQNVPNPRPESEDVFVSVEDSQADSL